MSPDIIKSKVYANWLKEIKEKVRSARVKAALAANSQMIFLYWDIGNSIIIQQEKQGWGAKVIERLSADLKKEFPDMKGLSPRNLGYMKRFAQEYPEFAILQQPAAKLEEIPLAVRQLNQLSTQLPWYHNCLLIDKIKDVDERLWYMQQTIQNGWSRNVLLHHIDTNLYQRKKNLTHNFTSTLPNPQSDLAVQILKEPYVFDFLTIDDNARGKEIEQELTKHISKFLLELGVGFSFVANQYHLEVEGDDFYIDLLFYHLKLRCYVAIELKKGPFKPEYTGKINFYLSALDELVKTDKDNPSIGILLCQTKKKMIAEYALRDMSKPIGISNYQLTEVLPEEFKSSLPTIEELETELTEHLKSKNNKQKQ